MAESRFLTSVLAASLGDITGVFGAQNSPGVFTKVVFNFVHYIRVSDALPPDCQAPVGQLPLIEQGCRDADQPLSASFLGCYPWLKHHSSRFTDEAVLWLMSPSCQEVQDGECWQTARLGCGRAVGVETQTDTLEHLSEAFSQIPPLAIILQNWFFLQEI